MSKPRDQAPGAAEHAVLRAWLQGRGVPVAQVRALIGSGPDSRTRRQLEQVLTAWLKTRPKGP